MKTCNLLIVILLSIAHPVFAQDEVLSQNTSNVKPENPVRKNGLAMTTGLASFSLSDESFNSYSSNTAGENGVSYRRNFGRIFYIQTELNFQRKFTELPSANGDKKIRLSEKLVQLPIAVYIGNPHKYNVGAINYSFGVGAYITKPFKQIYKSEDNGTNTSPYKNQINYAKGGYLFDTVVLLNATDRATVSIGFRSTFDIYSIKSSSVQNAFLFRSYSINIGSAYRW